MRSSTCTPAQAARSSRASPAPLTLVANPGGYDLVIDGRAGEAPTHRGLSIDQAATLVKSLSGDVAA